MATAAVEEFCESDDDEPTKTAVVHGDAHLERDDKREHEPSDFTKLREHVSSLGRQDSTIPAYLRLRELAARAAETERTSLGHHAELPLH